MALGEILRAEREKQGYTLSQVAQNTNLLVQVVEALENEDFRRIAAAIYGRGFVRLYADFLGLDPVPLVQDFMELYDGSKPPVVKTRANAVSTPSPPSKPAHATAAPAEKEMGTSPVRARSAAVASGRHHFVSGESTQPDPHRPIVRGRRVLPPSQSVPIRPVRSEAQQPSSSADIPSVAPTAVSVRTTARPVAQTSVSTPAQSETPVPVTPTVRAEIPVPVASPARPVAQASVSTPAQSETPVPVTPTVRAETPVLAASPAEPVAQASVSTPAQSETPVSVTPTMKAETPASAASPAQPVARTVPVTVTNDAPMKEASVPVEKPAPVPRAAVEQQKVAIPEEKSVEEQSTQSTVAISSPIVQDVPVSQVDSPVKKGEQTESSWKDMLQVPQREKSELQQQPKESVFAEPVEKPVTPPPVPTVVEVRPPSRPVPEEVIQEENHQRVSMREQPEPVPTVTGVHPLSFPKEEKKEEQFQFQIGDRTGEPIFSEQPAPEETSDQQIVVGNTDSLLDTEETQVLYPHVKKGNQEEPRPEEPVASVFDDDRQPDLFDLGEYQERAADAERKRAALQKAEEEENQKDVIRFADKLQEIGGIVSAKLKSLPDAIRTAYTHSRQIFLAAGALVAVLLLVFGIHTLFNYSEKLMEDDLPRPGEACVPPRAMYMD